MACDLGLQDKKRQKPRGIEETSLASIRAFILLKEALQQILIECPKENWIHFFHHLKWFWEASLCYETGQTEPLTSTSTMEQLRSWIAAALQFSFSYNTNGLDTLFLAGLNYFWAVFLPETKQSMYKRFDKVFTGRGWSSLKFGLLPHYRSVVSMYL